MKATILVISLASVFSGCKKNHTCECFNPGGVYATYTIRDSKKNAEKKCAGYDESSVPMDESACLLK